MASAARWLRRIVAVLTVVLLALLAWQCVDIYAEGEFTREIVGERLRYFALPGGIYALLALAAAFLGKQEEKILPVRPDNLLRILKRRVNSLPEGAQREEIFRRRIWIAAGGALAICAAFCLLYLLDGRNFVSWDMELVMGRLVMHIAPWIAAACAVIWGAAYLSDMSIKREIAALKPDRGAAKPMQKEARLPINWARTTILAIAAALIVVGALNGGMRDVLVKAINICTECIGLG